MNSFAHRLSLFSAIMHILIGLPEFVLSGPRFLPPAWAALYAMLPDWGWRLWPGLFIVTGLVAAVGVRRADALRMGFQLSGFCFLIWSLAGLYSWWAGTGSTVAGVATNFYITGAAWVLAHYVSLGVQSDRLNERIVALARTAGEASHKE